MARKSVIARERKRERLVARYAEKREQLKKEGRWEELGCNASQLQSYSPAQSLPIDRPP
ncbi:MAG: hypothetical protein R2795_00215 [Saprospiraceae bacterium]